MKSRLNKSVKRKIREFVGDSVFVKRDFFVGFIINLSHEIIKDEGMSAHIQRKKLKLNMKHYCGKLIKKNKERVS